MMNSLQTSHRGRKMSPLELYPPLTSEFLQHQPPGLFYRCQQPLQIPLNHKEACYFIVYNSFHLCTTPMKICSMLSKIHLHNFHIFSFFTGKFSTWLKWWRWYTSKVGHLLNHRRFTATSEITEDSVVCFIEEEEKNNAFTLEFVHINNGSECTQRARAPTSINNALVYFTI